MTALAALAGYTPLPWDTTVRPGWPPFAVWVRQRRVRRAVKRVAAAQVLLISAYTEVNAAAVECAAATAEIRERDAAASS